MFGSGYSVKKPLESAKKASMPPVIPAAISL